MERVQELQYIFSFADEGCFDSEFACNQLRCLWTAYSLHHDLDVDTSEYDKDLVEIWQVANSNGYSACWNNYDSFEVFMCTELV